MKKRFIESKNHEVKEIKDNDLKLEVTTDLELYNRLHKVRDEFAKKERVLPQAIITMNSLKEISGRYPNTLDKLKDISGMGPKKISSYGDIIVKIVHEYLSENNKEISWTDRKRKKVIIDGEIRENDQIAIDMLKNKINIHEISEKIELSISTILGYVTEYIKEFGENIFDINLEEFYNEEDEELIVNACEKNGYNQINILKKELPSHIKYESIRSVILKKYFL